MTKDSASRPRPARRWLLAAVLVPTALVLGFGVGGIAGSQLFVPDGAGLEGVAVVVFSALAGALLAGLGAVLASWRLPARWVPATTLAAGVVLVLFVGLTLVRAWGLRSARRAQLGLDAPLPAAAGFVLAAEIDESEEMRRYRRLELDGDRWRVAWTAVGPEVAPCTAEMTAAEAGAILAIVESIDATNAEAAARCLEDRNAGASHSFDLARDDPQQPPWRIETDRYCLERQPELARLDQLLARLPMETVSQGRANCKLP